MPDDVSLEKVKALEVLVPLATQSTSAGMRRYAALAIDLMHWQRLPPQHRLLNLLAALHRLAK